MKLKSFLLASSLIVSSSCFANAQEDAALKRYQADNTALTESMQHILASMKSNPPDFRTMEAELVKASAFAFAKGNDLRSLADNNPNPTSPFAEALVRAGSVDIHEAIQLRNAVAAIDNNDIEALRHAFIVIMGDEQKEGYILDHLKDLK